MNDRDRKDLFTVEDPFEDEQAPAPAIAADAPGARQAAEAPFCEPGLDAVIASAFAWDRPPQPRSACSPP